MRCYLLTLMFVLAATVPAWSQQTEGPQNKTQQESNKPPTVSGTITEIKTQGKLKMIVVTNDEGKTMEVPLTPRLSVDIKASGDKGFIRSGTFIGAQGDLSNEAIFVKEVNVLLPKKGQKLPRGKISKASRGGGTLMNSYNIIGTIQATKPNPDYPEYTMVALDTSGKNPVINLEKDYTVKVVSADFEMIQEGMKVVLTGRLNRGRVQISKVEITRKEPFKSDEILGVREPEKTATKK